MTVLVVGSRAIMHNLKCVGGLPWRPISNDADIIADYDSGISYIKSLRYTKSIIPIGGGKKVIATDHRDHIIEMEIAWPGTTGAALLDGYQKEITHIASSDVVFMLKHSHKHLRNNPHFQKTRGDIIELAKLNCGIPIKMVEWYECRTRETYNYPHPNLKQSSDTFFDPTMVKYVYDHDSIHRAVAISYQPAYLSYMADGEAVRCDHNKFKELPIEVRFRGVIEEAMVLALERSLIPHPGVKTPREAFLFALEKVCTSITSGWFRAFAYTHYDEIMDLVNLPGGLQGNPLIETYYLDFRDAIAAGKILPFKG